MSKLFTGTVYIFVFNTDSYVKPYVQHDSNESHRWTIRLVWKLADSCGEQGHTVVVCLPRGSTHTLAFAIPAGLSCPFVEQLCRWTVHTKHVAPTQNTGGVFFHGACVWYTHRHENTSHTHTVLASVFDTITQLDLQWVIKSSLCDICPAIMRVCQHWHCIGGDM